MKRLSSNANALQNKLFAQQLDYLQGLYKHGLFGWFINSAFKQRSKFLANYYSEYLRTNDPDWELIFILEYTIVSKIVNIAALKGKHIKMNEQQLGMLSKGKEITKERLPH